MTDQVVNNNAPAPTPTPENGAAASVGQHSATTEQPATRPDEIKVELTGKHAGLWAICRTDVSAKVAFSLDNMDTDLLGGIAAFGKIIKSHNLPDMTGEPADDLGDVPVRIIGAVLAGWRDGVTALPNA
jgi:hypothetical protein